MSHSPFSTKIFDLQTLLFSHLPDTAWLSFLHWIPQTPFDYIKWTRNGYSEKIILHMFNICITYNIYRNLASSQSDPDKDSGSDKETSIFNHLSDIFSADQDHLFELIHMLGGVKKSKDFVLDHLGQPPPCTLYALVYPPHVSSVMFWLI